VFILEANPDCDTRAGSFSFEIPWAEIGCSLQSLQWSVRLSLACRTPSEVREEVVTSYNPSTCTLIDIGS